MELTTTAEYDPTGTVRITADSLMAVSVFIRYFLILADIVSKSLEEAKSHEGLTDGQRKDIEDMCLRLEVMSEAAKEVVGIFELSAGLAGQPIAREVVISLFNQDAHPGGGDSDKGGYVH